MVYCIAIVGGSGSGKTTLAEHLLPLLPGAVILSEDRFYWPKAETTPNTNFDRPDAKDRAWLLRAALALKAGEAVSVPAYDMKTHDRKPDIDTIGPAKIVIIEGLHVLYEEALRALVDYAVFLDASAAFSLKRRLERDVRARGRVASDVETVFRTKVQPAYAAYIAPEKAFADETWIIDDLSDHDRHRMTKKLAAFVLDHAK